MAFAVPEVDDKQLTCAICIEQFKEPKVPGGGLPYESDGDARRKIRINTLTETILGVAPALFNP